MPTIVEVQAREVFDSRGRPTVEAEIRCEGGRAARAIAPSGASTGAAEAWELRDGGTRLKGLGVRRAVEHVRTVLGPALIGKDAADQRAVDALLCELDGTPNKQHLGANAILACSLATAYAAADALGRTAVEHFFQIWSATHIGAATNLDRPLAPAAGERGRGEGASASNRPRIVPDENAAVHTSQPRDHSPPLPSPLPRGGGEGTEPKPLGDAPSLPLPMVNMISGGLHAGKNLDFQDFLIIPVGARSYAEALDWIVETYFQLGALLSAQGYEGVLVGDEGGYGPKLASHEQAIDAILTAVAQAGLQPGRDVGLALDVASTHFYRDGKYHLRSGGTRSLTSAEMVDELCRLADRSPILSIEDGVSEDDWDGWELLTRKLGAHVQLIGDDLFATNPERLRRGIDRGVANSVLIKLNQIGTLSETLATMRLALDYGYRPVVSARSGETEDVTIADLAVATGAGQIKIGSVARSERLSKYNQLLRWEERLGPAAAFAGRTPFVR